MSWHHRKCKHCLTRQCCPGRPLCHACRLDPAIRELFPTASKFGRRGVGAGNVAPLEPAPTAAAPGSVEKVAVMEARAERGEAIFSELDQKDWNGCDGQPIEYAAGRRVARGSYDI